MKVSDLCLVQITDLYFVPGTMPDTVDLYDVITREGIVYDAKNNAKCCASLAIEKLAQFDAKFFAFRRQRTPAWKLLQ